MDSAQQRQRAGASNSFHLGQKLLTAELNIAVYVTCWTAVQTQSAERPIQSPTPHLGSTFLLKKPLFLDFIFQAISFLLNTDTHFQHCSASHCCTHTCLRSALQPQPSSKHHWGVPLEQLDLLKGRARSYWTASHSLKRTGDLNQWLFGPTLIFLPPAANFWCPHF